MMRLKDTDALIEKLQHFEQSQSALKGIGLEPLIAIRTVREMVQAMPAVDAEPVRHGRWEFCGDDDLICSVCGARYYALSMKRAYYTGIGSNKMDGYAYCPHCGADMRDDE